MSLAEHARRELERAGWLGGDNHAEGLAMLRAVEAFAEGGWSGGSAPFGIRIVGDLLAFKPLMPLTDDPAEWMLIDDAISGPGPAQWQSTRRSDAFSEDGGKTYILLDELPVRYDRWPWLLWKLRLGEKPPGFVSPGRDRRKLKVHHCETSAASDG